VLAGLLVCQGLSLKAAELKQVPISADRICVSEGLARKQLSFLRGAECLVCGLSGAVRNVGWGAKCFSETISAVNHPS